MSQVMSIVDHAETMKHSSGLVFSPYIKLLDNTCSKLLLEMYSKGYSLCYWYTLSIKRLLAYISVMCWKVWADRNAGVSGDQATVSYIALPCDMLLNVPTNRNA